MICVFGGFLVITGVLIKVPIWLSLGIIAGLITVSIAASPRRATPAPLDGAGAFEVEERVAVR